MASKLDEFRSQNPVYDDIPDNRLVPALHKKFYSDMPEAEFHQAIGYSPASPRLVDRAKSGLTDLYNLPDRVIQAGTEALAAPKSVMEGYQPATAAEAPPGASSTPASQRATDFVRSAYEQNPDKRAGMLARQDWFGDLARQIDTGYKASDAATRNLPTAQNLDGRRESLIARNVQQGMDLPTASMTATSQAVSGDRSPVGKVTPSKFDFDLAAEYRNANPVLRGAVKGYEGYRQDVLGFLQAGADFIGAETAAGRFESGARESADAIAAIGEGKGGARLFEGAVTSIAQQLPLLVGGTMTGSQALVLGGMAAQSFGQEYAQGRSAGLDGQDAATRASLFAAFEVVGEKFGLGNTLKALKMSAAGVPTKDLAAELGKALAKEVPGEVLTTTGQFVTDKIPAFGLNPEAGWGEYVSQVADTIGQTIIQSGLMMGGTSAANSAVRHLAARRGDATTGMMFAPDSIDAAARAALNPENARLHLDPPAPDLRTPAPNPDRTQIEQILQQREAQAIASGDPLEVAVTRAENAAARAHTDTSAQAPQTEAAPIDQQNLLQRVRGFTGRADAEPNAAAPVPAERSPATSASVQQAGPRPLSQSPAPLLMSNGLPFPTEQLAATSAKMRRFDMRPVPVAGGWGLMPTSAPAANIGRTPVADTGEMRASAREPAGGKLAGSAGRLDVTGLSPAGLLFVTRAHADPAMRDAAAAELRRREEDYAYRQPEEQKASELGLLHEQAVDQNIAQAVARAQAAGVNQDTDSAMAAAFRRAGVASDLVGERINQEWASFAHGTGTLGIPRNEMPQIKAENRGALVNFLNARGVDHQQDQVPADSLRPTQAEFSPRKVRQAMNRRGGDRSILISADGYVLDGHHQWLAKRETGEPIKVIRLGAPIHELVTLAREFPSSTTARGAGRGQSIEMPSTAGAPVEFAPVVRRRVIDVAATTATLPPVPAGFVRLYRAESPAADFGDVFNADGLQDLRGDGMQGKFYTTDLGYADYFRLSYGRNAKLHYLDVPATEAERYRLNDYEFKVPQLTQPQQAEDLTQPARALPGSTGSEATAGRNAEPAASVRGERGTPLARLTGRELGDFGGDVKALRKAAIDWYRNNLQGQPAVHPTLGEIRFTKKGRDEVERFSADPDKLRLVPALRQLIENGQHARTEPIDHPRRDGIVAFHIVEGDIALEGRVLHAMVDIGQDENGNLFYELFPDAASHEAKKNAHRSNLEPKSKPPAGAEEDISASLTSSISDDGLNIKILAPGGEQRITTTGLIQAVADRIPGIAPAVQAMLRRGETGEPGGLVLINRADERSITEEFARRTGRDLVRNPGNNGRTLSLTPDAARAANDAPGATHSRADSSDPEMGAGFERNLTQPVLRNNGRLQGFFDPQSGLTFLVAPNLTEQTAPAVLLHEAMHGRQRAEIDARALALINDRERSYKPVREFLTRVADRMQSANEAGNASEAAAYIVELAATAGRQAGFSAVDGRLMNWVDLRLGKRVGNLVRDFVAMVRAWVMRSGSRGLNLTVDDLVALARLNVQEMARGKVIVANTGRRDGPQFSRAGDTAGQAPAAPPLPPDETAARAFQRRWQDKFNRFTVVQDWLQKQGVGLTEQANVYRAEERMHGRAASRIEDFREQRVKPLIKKIRAAGFDMTTVADFLHAQHAEERNAQIAKINSDMPDGGSGMTNAEAQGKLAQYRTQPELVKLANELRAITDDSKRTLLEAGILSQEMADAWSAAYQHYVPLKGGPEEDAAIQGTGRGLTVKEKSKRALGHGAREEWIVENILRDHERAILQAEKNRVGQHLLELAVQAGHPDLITIGQPVKRKVLKDTVHYEVRFHGSTVEVFRNLADAQRYVGIESLKAGRQSRDFAIQASHDLDVVMMPSPVLDPAETQVYVNGHAIRVQFKDQGLARAWNNLGAEAMNVVFRMAREVNNFLSRAYTGYNPEFLAVNVVRDLGTGVANLTGEEGAGFALATLKNYPGAFAQLLNYARTGKASNWIKQYRDDGGTTGAAYLSDLERVGRDVQATYDEYAGVMQAWRAGGSYRAARAATRKLLGPFVRWIEKLNMAGENAMRLAAYQTAVERGQSRAQAASLAKNVSVNFNRRGELGQVAGSLYLFLNPAIQGSASISHALFKGKHKLEAQALASAIVGAGYVMAMLNGGGPEDEYEKLPEFQKERTLPIWTGDGWITIPIPYGYGFFMTLGRQLAELSKGADAAKVSLRLASNFINEFTVMGAAADAEGDERNVTFLLPTIPQIVMSPIINRTSLGAPIYPESSFDQSQPDNLKMNRATQGTPYHYAARELNAITGGNAIQKGWIDISPETLRYLWTTATGGTGRFLVDTAVLAKNLTIEGLPLADVESREVPIVRKFVQPAGDIRSARAAFWKAADEVDEARETFNRAKKLENHAERADMARQIVGEFRELLMLGRALDARAKIIKAHRDAVGATMADESRTLTERRAMVREIEIREKKLYDDFVSDFKARKQ